MKNIKCVVFDLDGVLTETSEAHFLAWKQMADEIGINIDRKFNENLKGVSRMESLRRILIHGGKESIYTDTQKDEFARVKNENYVKMISKYTSEDAFPGVLDTLKMLKEHNIKLVLGSASKNGPNLLKWLGIDGYFDYVVDPSSVPGKPAPDIFLKGAEIFHAPIENCVGIEDAYSGITAIKSASMFAIGIGDAEMLGHADIVYPEFKDIDFTRIDELLEMK